MTCRLASVAETVNCQSGNPNLRANSVETITESSVGNIAVIPRSIWLLIAATVGAGECPVIDPVSPRQRSIYSCPSRSTKCAPLADATKSGYAPGHLDIHDIGTPPGMTAFAASNCSRLLGVRARNRSSSRIWSLLRCSRLIVLMISSVRYRTDSIGEQPCPSLHVDY